MTDVEQEDLSGHERGHRQDEFKIPKGGAAINRNGQHPGHALRPSGRSYLASTGAAVLAGLGPLVEHFVDETERLCFVRFEELVAVHRFFDLLERLTGVLGI